MPVYRDEAIVLRAQKLGEADRIVTLLTRAHGRVRGVARGVRKTSSRIGARVEPFSHVDVQLYEGRSLDTVTQVESIAAHGAALSSDYPRWTAGTAMLDEMPPGRTPVTTHLVNNRRRPEIVERIRAAAAQGRQAYWVCPLIEESEKLELQTAVALHAELTAILGSETSFASTAPGLEASGSAKVVSDPNIKVGLLHGRMKPDDKAAVMAEFVAGKVHVLVATTVIEVGVDVPNASLMVIEHAERFGLAQLHQLRGRVMRSTYQAYCYAFTETNSVKSIERLRALATAKNGFELAELDLSQRGAGELSGLKQWGVSDVAMEALKNLKMVEAARTEAARIVIEDPALLKYPELRKEVEQGKIDLHFE